MYELWSTGTDLYYLPRDNLEPEKFELIMSPSHARSRIDSEYVFDDNWSSGFQLVNMQRRAFNGYTNQLPPHGPREREKLKSMVYGGGGNARKVQHFGRQIVLYQ